LAGGVNNKTRAIDLALWELDREGRQITLTDAVIACSARRVAADVLTRDKHVRWIDGIRVIESLED